MKPRETDNISTCWQHLGRCSAWQHVNMLSIFRGEPSNIQYQYLGEAKTTIVQILTSRSVIYFRTAQWPVRRGAERSRMNTVHLVNNGQISRSFALVATGEASGGEASGDEASGKRQRR